MGAGVIGGPGNLKCRGGWVEGDVEFRGEGEVHPLGMIDKRVSIGLVQGIHSVVSELFGGVDGVGRGPFQEGAETAHECVGAGYQCGLVGEDQSGFVGDVAGVTDCHVKEGACDVAFYGGGWFPGIGVRGAKRGFGVGGIAVSGRGGIADVVEFVAAGAVHVGVFGAEIMEVGVGGFAAVEAVTVAPLVFAVPAGGQAEGAFWLGALFVKQNDVVGVGGIFVQHF